MANNNDPLAQFVPQPTAPSNSPQPADNINKSGSADPLAQFAPQGSSQPQQPQDNLSQAIASLQKLKDQPSVAQHMQAVNDTSGGLAQQSMNFIDTFNNQMSKLPNGIMQILGLDNVKAPGGMSINQQAAQHSLDAQRAEQQPGWGATIGNVAGLAGNAINSVALGQGAGAGAGMAARAVAPELAGSIGDAAGAFADEHGTLAATANSAGQGAAFSGEQYIDPTSDQSRLQNTAIGAGIGALAVPATGLISKTINNAVEPGYEFLQKMFNPEAGAMENVLSKLEAAGVTPEEFAASNAAGNRVLHGGLSIGESVGNDANGLTSLDSALRPQSEADRELVIHHMNAVNGLGQKAVDMVNSIVPEGSPTEVSQLVNQGYEGLKNAVVPEDQMKTLMQNTTLQKYMNDLNNSPYTTSELQNLPNNNAYKLEAINQNINKDLYSGSKLGTVDAAKVTNTSTAGLNEAKELLQDTLGDNAPGYNKLLDLAGRNSSRNKMLDDIANIQNSPRTVGPNGDIEAPINKVYKTLWGDNEQQANFINMVQKSGGDVNAAKDLINVTNKVVNTPVQTILKGTRVAAETAEKKEESESILRSAINNLTTKDYNSQLLQLSLGGAPAQARILAAMQRAPLADRIVGLHQILDGMKAVSSLNQQAGVLNKVVSQSPQAQGMGNTVGGFYRGLAPAILGGNPAEEGNGGEMPHEGMPSQGQE